MNKWMNEWMKKLVKWIDRMNDWMNEYMKKLVKWIDRMNKWMNKWIGKEGLKGGCLEYEKTCQVDWRGWINEWMNELERKGWRVVLGVWKNAGSSVNNLLSILLLITTSI